MIIWGGVSRQREQPVSAKALKQCMPAVEGIGVVVGVGSLEHSDPGEELAEVRPGNLQGTDHRGLCRHCRTMAFSLSGREQTRDTII